MIMKEVGSDVGTPLSDFSIDDTQDEVQQRITQSQNGVWKKDIEDIMNFINGPVSKTPVIIKSSPIPKPRGGGGGKKHLTIPLITDPPLEEKIELESVLTQVDNNAVAEAAGDTKR